LNQMVEIEDMFNKGDLLKFVGKGGESLYLVKKIDRSDQHVGNHKVYISSVNPRDTASYKKWIYVKNLLSGMDEKGIIHYPVARKD
jgi:hypothetical protein